MGEKMRALVFHGPHEFAVEEVDVPEISEDEMLVRVTFAGVCGTDNRIYQGTKKIEAPRITGHEFSGVIEKLGGAVSGYEKGERVCVYPMIYCGQCYACKSGSTNICIHRTTIGYEIDGGFAQYVRVPAEAIACGNVVKIPDAVPDQIAAIAEPIAAAYHGIQRCRLSPGQTLVIIGAGPIGLFHLQLARTGNPAKIIVSEPQKEKRELAERLGADAVIDPASEDAEKIIFRETGGDGADTVIIDVGRPEAVVQSLQYVKKGGRVVLFAGLPAGTSVTIDPNVIHYREIEFTGSSSSSGAVLKTVLELLAQGAMDTGSMISGVFALDDWQEAFEMKNNYIGVKTIIDPWR